MYLLIIFCRNIGCNNSQLDALFISLLLLKADDQYGSPCWSHTNVFVLYECFLELSDITEQEDILFICQILSDSKIKKWPV